MKTDLFSSSSFENYVTQIEDVNFVDFIFVVILACQVVVIGSESSAVDCLR